jgi:hypothetical protein
LPGADGVPLITGSGRVIQRRVLAECELPRSGTSVACPTRLFHRQSGTQREPLPRCHPLAGRLQSGQGSLPDLSGGTNRSLAPERDDAADQDED